MPFSPIVEGRRSLLLMNFYPLTRTTCQTGADYNCQAGNSLVLNHPRLALNQPQCCISDSSYHSGVAQWVSVSLLAVKESYFLQIFPLPWCSLSTCTESRCQSLYFHKVWCHSDFSTLSPAQLHLLAPGYVWLHKVHLWELGGLSLGHTFGDLHQTCILSS